MNNEEQSWSSLARHAANTRWAKSGKAERAKQSAALLKGKRKAALLRVQQGK